MRPTCRQLNLGGSVLAMRTDSRRQMRMQAGGDYEQRLECALL